VFRTNARRACKASTVKACGRLNQRRGGFPTLDPSGKGAITLSKGSFNDCRNGMG